MRWMVSVLFIICQYSFSVAQTGINIKGSVFGGARQANVGGHTFVNIGAEHHDVIINAVYGGNDISGTIGSSSKPTTSVNGQSVPLVDTDNHVQDLDDFNVFVRTNKEATGKHLFIGQLFGGGYGDYEYAKINSGEDNGRYFVTVPLTVWNTNTNVYDIDKLITLENAVDKPEIAKAYIDIHGGTFGYVYGGGNNVTVTETTHLCINNESEPWKLIGDDDDVNTDDDVISDTDLQHMGINTEYFVQNGSYNFSRVFGGNNKAPMAIMPKWHLQAGKIENLYGGGNEGSMTSPIGLLLEINPEVPNGATYAQANEIKNKLVVENVFGGCRKADVNPLLETGVPPSTQDIQLTETVTNGQGEEVPKYNFPAGLPARVLVYGGDINNVYGGNDVKGRVVGGNSVGVYTSIRGSIYGGGNGSYPYTDNDNLIGDPHYGDFYYNPTTELTAAGVDANSIASKLRSVVALNLIRPNAEQVSIRVKGDSKDHPTIIGGSIYCGGNSATLATTLNEPLIELKIGSFVIADNVFLGNNGENMVKYNEKSDTEIEGVLRTMASKVTPASGSTPASVALPSSLPVAQGERFNSMDLTDSETFAKYMDGCALDLMPNVKFDDNYQDYSTNFGSFFCGGNVGSMTKAEQTTISFNKAVIIYEKVVGGCNNAFVAAKPGFNANFEGGIIGSLSERNSFTDGSGNIKNRIVLNFNGLKIQPKRWVVERDGDYNKILDADGKEQYKLDVNGNRQLELQTISAATGKDVAPVLELHKDDGEDFESSDAADLDRRLKGGNIYGGCYNSGIVNGNVVINLNTSVVDRKGQYAIFDQVIQNEGEALLYESDSYQITERRSGVLLDEQGMDVLGKALNVFGGGYGENSEVWGSTTINLNAGYTFQIFGGGEKGVIGKANDPDPDSTDPEECSFNGKTFKYNPKYSCYINVKGQYPGVYRGDEGDSDDMAEAEFIYGGAFFSPIAGNTIINLGNGRVFNTFAGSCNGDILGHTETYVGRNISSDSERDRGFPWVRDHIYGGNDLGGRIKGKKNFYDRVSNDAKEKVYNPQGKTTPDVTNASAYIEYIQGRIDYIFGGCYGVYDYTDSHYKDYTYTAGETGIPEGSSEGTARKETGFIKPRLDNAFINFRPINYQKNEVTRIYGAGQGITLNTDRDVMQNRSYILIDIPQTLKKFENTVVFGAGDYCGLGMSTNAYTTTLDASYVPAKDNGVSFATAKANADGVTSAAVIDLVSGTLKNVYGGSYKEGITRRTIVNVPTGSTIQVNQLFGGAYGTETYLPCDVYEANVNYKSDNATVSGSIYGGNNNERRTIYGKVNIYATVWANQKDGYLGKVYGAGLGGNTWSEYTEVNLERGAKVYEAYGGGEEGKVYNAESVQNFMNKFKPADLSLTDWKTAWTLGYEYDPASFDFSDLTNHPITSYATNEATNLNNSLVRWAEVDDRYNPDHEEYRYANDTEKKFEKKYNANVLIKEGATVTNYGYGGGKGAPAVVAGTTYIALLGGVVEKDLYASGTSGSVMDQYGAGGFVASANAYIEGGTVRNVFGGGWRGSVGYTKYQDGAPILYEGEEVKDADGKVIKEQIPDFGTDCCNDILGESHVIIGKPIIATELPANVPEGQTLSDYNYLHGIPSITRNVYGGGEGGAIYGTAYVTMYNGRVGYRYKNIAAANAAANYDYAPENDDKPGDGALEKWGGNVFGGGYVANSYTDVTDVNMYGGVIRGSLFGGGEIGPVGRGTVRENATSPVSGTTFRNATAKIYKGGETHVDVYGGHIMHNVFGGGRGYDNWYGDGYMTDAEKKTMDLSSKGYVFGTTEVHVHGGEVGTAANALLGYGNVFGGGDEGFVYSATGTKHGTPVSDTEYEEGYPRGGGGFYYTNRWVNNDKSTWEMTTDCCVTITPFCKVTGTGLTIDKSYNVGDMVEVEALNTLRNKKADTRWGLLDREGITIHNAVFAGGNITEGNDLISASTVTVYGNAGAVVRDVYNYDLITLGSDDVGGIYGDGNLTLVDGFREIHIDNYGTDYYSLDPTMDMNDVAYTNLTERQKAYYQLKYVTHTKHTYRYYECNETHVYEGLTYKRGQKLSAIPAGDNTSYWVQGIKDYQAEDQIDEGEYLLMEPAPSGEQANWVVLGVCSKYAGRPLNTIQRADMCGVFGSRVVLKGAYDRVPHVIDYATYTINRVDEVSLNRRTSTAPGDESDDVNKEHGNYFGIYNSVKFLGNLTSDVSFDDVRVTNISEGSSAPPADGSTYYQWKAANPTSKYRNNGISQNKVALASGVYLEIKREEGESTGIDDWGYITGVVELDLINVMPGMGGGYVYARNEHGTKTWHGNQANSNYWGHILLLDDNWTASTYRRFEYNEAPPKNKIETSGNFVHNTKQIIDDCYPNGGMYNPETAAYTASPAHYWFIKGSIYVYEQYISAYTGSANAYAKKVDLPLTISAASNGKMTLREVQPNYYAYYEKNGNKIGDPTIQNVDTVFVANGITYHLNEPISYWQYNILDEGDKSKFVKETYVTIQDCTIGSSAKKISSGYVMLPGEYTTLKATALKEDFTPDDGIDNPVEYVLDDQGRKVLFDFVFRPSNNLSHETGFILTYEVNNPDVWNHYYTKEDRSDKKVITAYNDEAGYLAAPTFTPKTSGVYGQHEVKVGQIINGNVVTAYQALTSNDLAGKGDQATVEVAWVAKEEVKYTYDGLDKVMNTGATISNTEYSALSSEKKASFEQAKVCTNLLEFSETDFVFNGKVLTSAEIATLKTKVIEKNEYVSDGDGTATEKAEAYLADYIADAYICTDGGWYGGTTYSNTKAYRALDTFSDMQKSERDEFLFNYDALDLLIDPTYGGGYGFKPQYDGYNPGTTQEEIDAREAVAQYTGSSPLNPQLYSATQQIDYEAEFIGSDNNNPNEQISYTKADGTTIVTITEGDEWLSREAYESIPNEKRHYTPIIVTKPGNYYVVNSPFIRGDVPYTIGQVIEDEVFSSLTDLQKNNIVIYNFKDEHVTQKKKQKVNAYDEPLYLDSDDNETTEVTDKPVYVEVYLDSEGHETTEAIDGEGNSNTPVYDEVYYYYCRENYIVNEKGMGQSVTTVGGIGLGDGLNAPTTSAVTYDRDDEVPTGAIITKEGSYDNLPNYQKGFAIHGKSPTETSTLYVSSESDIYNLTKERIITVIYLYEYEESDESGDNVTPVSERHIVNIHIDFKSGSPEIGKLKTPNIVLPGTAIGMELPSIKDGALPITDSGWEIYSNDIDASTHTNGKEYINNDTPVYWYQNGYWIAYWAESQLGRAYSNSVEFSVANYHDIKKVMDDKTNHYYIDHKDMDYEPKIYINDYSGSGDNGLDIFKNLIDLTYVPQTYDNTTGELLPISGGVLDGHMPMDTELIHKNKNVQSDQGTTIQGGAYYEFILRTDIDHGPTTAPDPDNEGQTITTNHPWTPIASETGKCFSGNFHGDGHTISGLDHSLFDHLCGNVYNVGVTGPFTSAGIAETGGGFVENCWIKSTATSGFLANDVTKAIFNNPDDDNKIHVVNCYYPEAPMVLSNPADPSQGYVTLSPYYSTSSLATPMDSTAFYNGTVAYNLNGFYLYKRYCDKMVNAGSEYKYYTIDPETNQLTAPQSAHYASNITYCSSGYGNVYDKGYVEDRFADGDFRYANESTDSQSERAYIDTEDDNKVKFYPIWPDDYLFFGQMLTYGYSDEQKHQSEPSVIAKSDGRLLNNDQANRVYRAPAYYRSKEMGVAHFNPWARLAAHSKPKTITDKDVIPAYPNMTAIDFAGHNDKTYRLGFNGNRFYQPLLDDDGLQSIENISETRNLLVYAPAETPETATASANGYANEKTFTVLTEYFMEPVYDAYYDGGATCEQYTDSKTYKRVAAAPTQIIMGHLVQEDLFTDNDHLLVDKEDFNCPIAYTMGNNFHMWYQRVPSNHVKHVWSGNNRSTNGWEGISLPFSAELVSTNQKGEITHFYSGSYDYFDAGVAKTDDVDPNSKVGHEYWLRGFTGIEDANSNPIKATFSMPSASGNETKMTKNYTNRFLWDYYYQYGNDARLDKNEDQYQQYYNTDHEYEDYPLLGLNPYIIGFPGITFYEFDLSGQFDHSSSDIKERDPLQSIAKIGMQTISFVSRQGADIGISDEETVEKNGVEAGVVANGYTFKPNYLNDPKLNDPNASPQTPVKHAFLLNAAGNSFVEDGTNTAVAKVFAFRPYFTALAGSSARPVTRSIIFSSEESELKGVVERGDPKEEAAGTLNIYAKKHKIIVESALGYTIDVRIVNLAGMTINVFSIEPGETVETRINNAGVYIVEPSEARFIKKLSVK